MHLLVFGNSTVIAVVVGLCFTCFVFLCSYTLMSLEFEHARWTNRTVSRCFLWSAASMAVALLAESCGLAPPVATLKRNASDSYHSIDPPGAA